MHSKKKNKIVHLVCSYPPYKGGMGNSASEMVKALKKQGLFAHVITPEYKGKLHNEEGVTRLKPYFSFGNAAIMRGLFKEFQDVDILHLHYPFFGGALPALFWKWKNKKKKLVIYYHMDARAGGIRGFIFACYRFFVLPLLLQAADKCIASTFDFLDSSDAGKHYRKNKKKWHELPFGVDYEHFSEERDCSHIKMKQNTKKLLFVGGMDKAHDFKGVSVLLEAASKLKKKNFDFELFLVGDGELRKNYEEQAKQLGIEKNIIFTGKVSYDDLACYYRQVDLLILAATSSAEAFGLVLLEAFAAGTSALASHLPGVRQIASIGGSTFEVRSAEALAVGIQTYFDFPLTKKQKDHLQAKIQKEYSWEEFAKKLKALYEL